jgi:hypothetical protein
VQSQKVTCLIPHLFRPGAGIFSETASESWSKELHFLASALCGSSLNHWLAIKTLLVNIHLPQPGGLDGQLSNRLQGAVR